MKTLGATLSSLRKSKGVSQELLAENSKVSLRTIQRIEGDLTVPRPYTLRVIADALGVPIETFSKASQVTNAADDADLVRLMNFSALAVCLVPFANLIIPLMIWRKKKTNKVVDTLGRRIINFQILWLIITLIVVLIAQVLIVGLTGSVTIGRLPPTLFLAYYFMVMVNIVFVLHAAIHLRSPGPPESIYPIAPSFF